jgi:hypothetical protein
MVKIPETESGDAAQIISELGMAGVRLNRRCENIHEIGKL